MRFEFFIANKLHLYSNDKSSNSSSFTLKVAIAGIVLAIIVMLASISIVSGFRNTIIDKISNLEPHIRISNGEYNTASGQSDSIAMPTNIALLKEKSALHLSSIDLIAEVPCILKTNNDFNGLTLKGIPDNYDTDFLSSCIVDGKFDTDSNNIVVSQLIANRLRLNVGERISVFFIKDGNIRQRKLTISGIFNTDFEDFDKNFIVGNIAIVQSVNHWGNDIGTSIEIRCKDLSDIDNTKSLIIDNLYDSLQKSGSTYVYQISTIKESNATYFAWLDLLDTNIIVILLLMTLVACFSLIAGLLIVVLNRINMIGILKSLGANNRCIRIIFMTLAGKIILKSLLWGNLIGFSILLIQKYLHIIKLDPATYYMSYVPIDINPWLIALNIGVLVVSAIALIGPSYIITSISPSKSVKFE